MLIPNPFDSVESESTAKAVALDPQILARANQIVHDGAKNYSTVQPRLLHGDFRLKHLFVNEDKISGIIDFEDAEGVDPIRHFARWDYYYEQTYPQSVLKEGYSQPDFFRVILNNNSNSGK